MNVGIDIGTTFSYVGQIDKLNKAKVIRDHSAGKDATPSVISLSQTSCLIGQPALDKLLVDPNISLIQFFKREIGSDKVIAYDKSGQSWYAEGLTGLMLKKMLTDAKNELQQKITKATLTVPVHFNEIQRSGMLHVGSIVGLESVELLDEPIAAALYYGFTTKETEAKNILVYDLGGGTFDISILKISPDKIFVVASDGDTSIGGKELDEVVMRLIREEIKTQTTPEIWNAYNLNLLRKQAEQIKKDLLSTGNQEVEKRITKDPLKGDVYTIPIVLGESVFTVSISLQEFFNGVFNLIKKTFVTVKRCIASSPFNIEDIDAHLFVGGSCDNQIVRHLYGEEFKVDDKDLHIKDPHLAVVLGAAIHANQNELGTSDNPIDFPEIRGVSGSEIGMKIFNPAKGSIDNHVLIQKNVSLPCFAKKIVYPNNLDQEYIKFEFFSRNTAEAISVGELSIGPLSIENPNYEIELSLQLNEKGMLVVMCLDMQTGEEVSSDFSLLNSIAIDQKELVRQMLIN
jgi:molecular chaperone DnaK